MMLHTVLFSMAVMAAFASPFMSGLDDEWKMWKETNKKIYEEGEELVRRLIWEENLQIVTKHNLEHSMGRQSYRMGMNKYADMKNKEVVAVLNGFKMSNKTKTYPSMFVSPSFVQIPKEVDWRNDGYVTPVKDQGQCGSCWAFSSTGSLEGQTFKKTGKLPDLSEQNLVDCSHPQGNAGCEGGYMDQAFEYVKTNNGIDSEECYPYEAVDANCRFQASCVTATCTGYTDIPEEDEDALKTASATVGPISVAIDASHSSFQMYESGVYDEPECSQSQLDHGVLVIGYGTDQNTGEDYWLVKNSWGTTWGDNGYIKMSRNKSNQCGIASSASYPLV